MVVFPIIPIWLMIIICAVLIIICLKYSKKNILRILMIILIFIINLRIMIPNDKTETFSNNLDVLFVIDSTISMDALDYKGNQTRLSGVKSDSKHIINELSGARFSVVSFDNNAKIVVPFTYDTDIVLDSIEYISPLSQTYATGSSLNTPYELIENIFKNNTDNDRTKVIFFISDGEITDESSLKSYKEISKYINGGAVLGYGTTQGGYMKYKEMFGSEKESYLMYYYPGEGYSKAVSKIDESNLKKIASDLKVDYIKMNNESDIDRKLTSIKNKTDLKASTMDKSSYDDIYYIFIIPLLVLMVLDFNKIRRKFI